MEPEIINPTPAGNGNKKKFLLMVLVVILAAAGALGYLFMQKGTSMPPAEVAVVVPEAKSAEQIEKERIIAELAQAIPKVTMSEIEKQKVLNNLAKKIPTVTLSNGEKQKILQSLASSTPQ